jgi:hypothetical protein
MTGSNSVGQNELSGSTEQTQESNELGTAIFLPVDIRPNG